MSKSAYVPSPTFRHPLGPSDEEVAEITTLLVEPTLRLRRLDDEIADLQKAIDKLAEERDNLNAFVDAHKALLSPARRLPLDIIQEIFVACIPTHRNCVMSASEAPVLLGRICSSWRALSLSTPRLWAKLHIVEPPHYFGLDPESQNKIAQRLQVTKSWLARSGEYPLSISLQYPPGGAPVDTALDVDPLGGFLLQALIPYAHRWQHIDCTTPPSAFDDLAHLRESDVPLLETVVLHPIPFNWISGESESFGMLRGPRVHSISASSNEFARDSLPLRWRQLTVLNMHGATWETSMTSSRALDVLGRCPELRTCSLVVNDRGSTEVLSHPPIELKFLHTLDLSTENVDSAFAHLLDCLSILPELRNFTLSGQADPETQTPPSMVRFIAHHTRLETLILNTDSFSRSSLLECLRSLPDTLQRLKMHDIPSHTLFSSLDDEALEVLTPTPGMSSAICCPALESLEIDYSIGISDAALLEFISARMGEGLNSKLRLVKMSFQRKKTVDILPALKPFIDSARLEVSITHVDHSLGSSPWYGL
ncbi:hypothetical protein C8R46DRAFT_1285428 [Mycena filopes]|nr:hypothetical protein C8R46DRAFT_1285428 [Mycena filopes]